MASRGRKSELAVPLHLKAHREAAGLKQEYIARRCGVSDRTISDWEHSPVGPKMIYLPILAKEYGCTIEDLYYPPKEAAE